MDLITHLEEENSKQNWQVVVDYVGNDSSRFDAVVNLFINGQQKIVQRIGQPFGTIAEKNPHFSFPYIPKLIAYLKANPIDAVKRNVMRSFQWIELPEEYVGEIFDLGMLYLRTHSESNKSFFTNRFTSNLRTLSLTNRRRYFSTRNRDERR